MCDEIKNAAYDAITELLSEAKPQKGQIVVACAMRYGSIKHWLMLINMDMNIARRS